MKTIQDQVKDLRNTRAHKAEQMETVAKKAIEEGRSMDAAEAEEFDTLESEIKQIDADLERFEKLEKLNVQKAAPVQQRTVEKKISGAPAIIVNKEADEKFKGQSYTRIVIAKALARLEDVSPVAIAQKRWGKSNPLLVEVVKAAVAGGGSGSGEWGAELVTADSRFTGDFIEYLYSKTVYDQLPFREIPANVTIKGQDGAATGYWTGENQPIKVSKADFNTVNLGPLKVAALAVVSNELLRDSSPAAEQLVRDSLVEASSQRIDSTLFSTAAAVGSVSPAGLLASPLSAIAATGLDADAVYDGIRSLYAPFITAKNASGLVYVMNPARAKAISLLRNAFGQKEFPDIRATGGTLDGDTVVTGDNVNEAHVILLKPSDIYKIGDGGLQVSISRDATLEQADDPTGETTGGTTMSKNMTSMFQTESTAIKVVRSINFAKRRASAVAYVGDASWGDSAS